MPRDSLIPPKRRARLSPRVLVSLAKASVTCFASPAMGQDVAGTLSVIVTGTNIPSVERENALPVEVITREQIERTNLQTAAQLVNTITASMGYLGFNEARGLRSAFAGFAGGSLRGLGWSSTLVLVNGRRIANYALATGRGGDLNAIPLSAVERVEVLKDGASAIYGSDAIAGVINFILRSEYEGADISAQYTSPEHTGGYAKRATAWAGVGNLPTQGFNAYVNVDYQKFGGIQARDRAFAARSYIPEEGVDKTEPQSLPANVNLGPLLGFRNPTGDPRNRYRNPPCFPPLSSVAATPSACSWFGDGSVSIVNSSEQLHVVGSLAWQVDPGNQFFFNTTWSRNQFTFTAWPAPVTFDLPATSAYYPHEFAHAFGVEGKPLKTNWRAQELGAQVTEPTTEQWNAVVGMRGVAKEWNYNGAFDYSRNKGETEFANGFVRRSLLLPILTSVVNPFGPNTPDVIERMATAKIDGVLRTGTSTLASFDFDAWKDVFALPAGPLVLAVGFNVMQERLAVVVDPALAKLDEVPGVGTSESFSGSRQDWALLGEARIPLLSSLDANVAVRYDHYSDFGGTTNPKVSLRWQPLPQLVLRTSAGTGFLAPPLPALYTPVGFMESVGQFNDPARCPTVPQDCNRTYQTRTGGNPGLEATTSTQWSAGGVWAPLRGLALGIDYVSILINDPINPFVPFAIFKGCPDGKTGPTCFLIHRSPVEDVPGLPGTIVLLDQILTNLGKKKVSAIDLNVEYVAPTQAWGQLAVNFTGTYNIEYLEKQVDGTYVDLVGTYAPPGGAIPRWRHYLVLNWTLGPWSATLSENFQTGVLDQFPASQPRKTGDYDVWNLGLSYAGFRNWAVSAGVKNLFDRDPPFSNQNGSTQVGYDPTYADPHGRLYWIAVSYSFK
jgi:iron complex outermembrane recepter protein